MIVVQLLVVSRIVVEFETDPNITYGPVRTSRYIIHPAWFKFKDHWINSNFINCSKTSYLDVLRNTYGARTLTDDTDKNHIRTYLVFSSQEELVAWVLEWS